MSNLAIETLLYAFVLFLFAVVAFAFFALIADPMNYRKNKPGRWALWMSIVTTALLILSRFEITVN